MAGRKSETGGSSISSILWLVVIAAAGYMLWNVAPVYMDHYSFQDKILEFARVPRTENPDEVILNRLMKEVRERRLNEYITPASFSIRTLETSRLIKVNYQRTVKILPGMQKTLKLNMEVDSPIPY
jgi:hypothetical protein